MEITTIGLDLAKNVFQVHALMRWAKLLCARRCAAAGTAVLCEAVAVSGRHRGMRDIHYWAREMIRLGHEVRLMPPAYVKPYVKRGKTDASDAEAICEAVTRPTMRFVAIKSAEQQAALALHRTRDLLVKQRTQLVNMIRGLLAEFGIEIPRGLTTRLRLPRS